MRTQILLTQAEMAANIPIIAMAISVVGLRPYLRGMKRSAHGSVLRKVIQEMCMRYITILLTNNGREGAGLIEVRT